MDLRHISSNVSSGYNLQVTGLCCSHHQVHTLGKNNGLSWRNKEAVELSKVGIGINVQRGVITKRNV